MSSTPATAARHLLPSIQGGPCVARGPRPLASPEAPSSHESPCCEFIGEDALSLRRHLRNHNAGGFFNVGKCSPAPCLAQRSRDARYRSSPA
eukprot:4900749-Pyramimonas_sp.AAC.1